MLTLFLEHFSLFYPEEITLLEVCVCLFVSVGWIFFFKFSFVLFDRILLCNSGWPCSGHIAEAGLSILHTLRHLWWVCMCGPPHPALDLCNG